MFRLDYSTPMILSKLALEVVSLFQNQNILTLTVSQLLRLYLPWRLFAQVKCLVSR